MGIEDTLEDFRRDRKADKEKKEQMIPLIVGMLEEAFPKDRMGHSGLYDVFSAAIRHYDNGDEHPGAFSQFDFESIVQRYTEDKLEHVTPYLLKIHEYLVINGYGYGTSFDTNDLDDMWCFLPTNNPELKVFTVTDQNFNFIVIMDNKFGDWAVQVRQFWESIDSESGQDYKKEFEEDPTFENALKSTDWMRQYYSDNVPGNTYVDRPDLKMFIDTNFLVGEAESCPGLRYGDCRDNGFVYAIGGFSNETEIHYHSLVKNFCFRISTFPFED